MIKEKFPRAIPYFVIRIKEVLVNVTRDDYSWHFIRKWRSWRGQRIPVIRPQREIFEWIISDFLSHAKNHNTTYLNSTFISYMSLIIYHIFVSLFITTQLLATTRLKYVDNSQQQNGKCHDNKGWVWIFS